MRLTSFALFAFLAACNDKPAKDPTPPPTTASVTPPPSATPTASASAAPIKCGKTTCPEGQTCCNADAGGSSIGAKCKLDSECELFSSYCQEAPCQCFAVGKGAGAPKCKSDRPVNCLVDPCGQKQAKCKDGVCATVAKTDR